MKRKKTEKKQPKSLEELFSPQWREGVKKLLADLKGSDNDLSKSIGNVFEACIAQKCLADIALEYAPKDLYGKIVVDTERILNELGSSFFREGEEVTTCLTRRHSDCAGSYINPHLNVKRTIICKCRCHSKNDSKNHS